MRILLDTHVFLWAVSGNRRLRADARRRIESADEVHVSAASLWEIAIKSRLGKIDADPSELAMAIGDSGFDALSVNVAHTIELARLPLLHGDPFDRLLISQAIVERMQLLTADEALLQYGEFVMTV